ncbi:MAG: radical SAM protein [Thermodesulfatator sp.]|nr:MAG: radical SAM protein [Thermodesulfatator sp.]
MKRRISKKAFRETGAIKKRWNSRVKIALVFPDSYALGMSNLGFQRVYELLNSHDHILAERFFLPQMRYPEIELRSLEAGRGLREFDLILFSISFEYSYLNVPLILELGKVPLYSIDRDDACPLVLAGGIACQINPEPIAPVMDGFLLGDFEAIGPRLAEFLEDEPLYGQPREKILERIQSQCPGVYVPLFFDASSEKRHRRIKPAILEDVPDILPHSVVLSEKAAFANTFLLEVSRGCGRGCRFCAAGFVYRPPRPWPIGNVLHTLDFADGVQKIGLVGLEFMEKAGLDDLISTLIQRGTSLGFSSLRADAVTPEFARLLAASGSKTATIAIEAGSEKLRKVINKNLSQGQIMACCDHLLSSGIRHLKLYFMLGLPFEEDSDVEEIVVLSRKILKLLRQAGRQRGNMGLLTVSVSTFVPKAWTPFQWASFIEPHVLYRRRAILEKGLRSVPNMKLKLDSPDKAFIQAVISRGDRDLAYNLITARLRGAGTGKMVKEIALKAEKYLRIRPEDQDFPWEIINHRVKRAFLLSQWKKSEMQRETSFCNTQKCRRCGACR